MIDKHTNLTDLLSKQLSAIENGEPLQRFITTGFKELDQLIGGFLEGELVIIASAPAIGKTQLLINLALHISTTHSTLFFSDESSEQVIVGRFLASISDIPFLKIAKNEFTDAEKSKLKNSIAKFDKYKIIIENDFSVSTETVREYCIKEIEEKHIQVIMIDRPQLFDEIEFLNHTHYWYAELKKIARKYHVCIIATSSCDLIDKTHIREWEMDTVAKEADKVIFLQRKEHYGIWQDVQGNRLKNILELSVLKNLSGAMGTIQLWRTDKFTNFIDFEHASDVLASDISEDLPF
jgi:replicative DNA helicase